MPIFVSIPRRYAENTRMMVSYMLEIPVSIPRRYAENERYHFGLHPGCIVSIPRRYAENYLPLVFNRCFLLCFNSS